MYDLYKLVEKVRAEGEVKAVSRLGMKVLLDAGKEGISISNLKPNQTCSADLYNKVKAAAAEILGHAVLA